MSASFNISGYKRWSLEDWENFETAIERAEGALNVTTQREKMILISQDFAEARIAAHLGSTARPIKTPDLSDLVRENHF